MIFQLPRMRMSSRGISCGEYSSIRFRMLKEHLTFAMILPIEIKNVRIGFLGSLPGRMEDSDL